MATLSAPSRTTVQASCECKKWKAWVIALRPHTVGASLGPLLLAFSLTSSVTHASLIDGWLFGVGFLVLQLVSNVVNDYADYRNGADDSLRVGPTRAAQAGWLSVAELQLGTLVLSMLSLALWGAVAVRGDWMVLGWWLFSWLGAVTYTAGPMPYGYRGWGDASVFVFFGLVAVVGNCYVQMGHAPLSTWAAGAVAGCTAAAVLNVNNLRDADSDRRTGKCTLVVRFGVPWGRHLYAATWVLAWSICAAMAVFQTRVGWLAPLLLVPLGVARIRAVHRLRGAALRPELGRTAASSFASCLLLAVGVWLESAWLQ